MDVWAVGGVFCCLRAHDYYREVFAPFDDVVIGKRHHRRHLAESFEPLLVRQLVEKISILF